MRSLIQYELNYYEMQKMSNYNRLLNDNINTVTNGMDNCLQKVVESMVRKVESEVLKVDDKIWKKFSKNTVVNVKMNLSEPVSRNYMNLFYI
ncbi:hypothetical protein Glove_49g28 [Diversispora epigaea]|uniref:Uncharacterized protein n=1 Tax=Diversispora epigaea TaxID=1348612 RepID=A0A397JQ23_9GLOM|nr:hypothetical protein Glove_49g28 [Diversispora epigaea]